MPKSVVGQAFSSMPLLSAYTVCVKYIIAQFFDNLARLFFLRKPCPKVPLRTHSRLSMRVRSGQGRECGQEHPQARPGRSCRTVPVGNGEQGRFAFRNACGDGPSTARMSGTARAVVEARSPLIYERGVSSNILWKC